MLVFYFNNWGIIIHFINNYLITYKNELGKGALFIDMLQPKRIKKGRKVRNIVVCSPYGYG